MAHRCQAWQRQGDARGHAEGCHQARGIPWRRCVQGGASFPRNKAAVRLSEGTRQGSGQEHRTGADAVCAVEPMDGATTVADFRGRDML